MKKLLLIILAVSTVLTMVACNSNDDVDPTVDETTQTDPIVSETEPTDDVLMSETFPAFDYLASDLTPYIVLGEYKNLTVTVEIQTITDEEYDAEIAALLEAAAAIPFIEEDRGAVEGDVLLVDYAGYMNDQLVDNTTAKNTTVEISDSSGYVPGFAEGFIGHKAGETFRFDVTFPENYGSSALASQTVTFECTIHGIYNGTEPVAPTLEQFVHTYTDFETVDEFNEYYRSLINQEMYLDSMSTVYELLFMQVIENSTAIAYPETEVERIYWLMRENYEMYAEYYGVDYETFLTYYVQTTDEGIYEYAREYIKEDLVLYALVKELDVEITEEEYAAGCANYAEQVGVSVEEFLSYYDEETIMTSLYWEEVVTIISETAEVIEE